MEKQSSLLSSQLCIQRRQYEVTLNSFFLAWKEIQTAKKYTGRAIYGAFKAGSHCVPVFEIIAVQEKEDDAPTKDTGKWQKVPQSPVHSSQHAFTVFYVERMRQHCWRCSDVTFHCSEWAVCLLWVQTIREQLALLTNRPKSLLVYINPYGGKQRGKQIYDHKVAPVFSRASISTDVIVTECANHARDHLKTDADLKKYDGVVCVGGDGMFSEIMHGLVSRTQQDAGVDENSTEGTLVPCGLRIGIIPAGSTDCICYATVGSNDPVTSALHIIVGDSQPMDVCSVHSDVNFLRYSVSLLGYGFYGDVLTDSERKRWMGPARYDISGVKTFLSHRYYEGTVSFLPAEGNLGTPRDKIQCRSGCTICQRSSSDKLVSKDEDSVSDAECRDMWTVIRGKFLAINAASMSCACPRSPKGLSPSAHLADGTTDLILVRKCSRLDFLRHLLRHTNKDDQFDHSFVEVYRVRQFSFKPRHQECDSEMDLRESGAGGKRCFSQICREHRACGCMPVQSNWNCDGEILPHTAIQVRVHCQLIRLFARGIEEQSVFEDPYALCAI
ncbi:ceramide kinase isoform X1 [Myxocyprinus asiaticus]|uniref:ceramide kinase isoform X1 n=1 Tax=Myxocyprinus asiaticus TaxID=70543 RepID=UPI002221F88F|nr:ceramide kinase isoform X1 [Myxocyprinus asiaticus]